MEKTCIACGMPMKSTEDYAMSDTNREYCRNCVNPDGTMHDWEQKVESMTAFMVKTQGLDPAAARNLVETMLVELPAWRERAGT